MKRFITFITCMAITIAITCKASDCNDSIVVSADTVAVDSMAQKPKGFINKIIAYFNESNKVRRNKKFDFSIIGGPHYSSDTKFGIGIVGSGLYRPSRRDTVSPLSNVAVYADATTSMFFKLGIRGTHIFPNDVARLNYDLNVAHVATRYCGIGYEMGRNDDNESKYKYFTSQAEVSYVWRLARNFYLGPMATLDYFNARDMAKPELWEGLKDKTFNIGVGFTVQYDNRDFLTNAAHGMYLRLDQRFNPRFLANKNAFSLTELYLSYYHPLWKSATIAMQLHSRLTYGNTPWTLLSTLGGSDNMRGYFEGRYRDKSEIDVCIELRQHVWRRNGVVVWVGAGTVFPKFSAMRMRQILPNYGIGYRWEFKRRVNVRLDLGFGRKQTGFIFSINEAF